MRVETLPAQSARGKFCRQHRSMMLMSWRRTIFSAIITIRPRSNCICRATFITRPRWRHWVLLRMRPGTRFNARERPCPLKVRMAIVPVTMIASQMLPFIIIGGLFFRITGLITLGIWCYLILLAFQLITLPVEFDASRRAKIILREMGIIQPGQETAGVNNVLNAATLLYIAAFIAALGNLLWLMSIRDRR